MQQFKQVDGGLFLYSKLECMLWSRTESALDIVTTITLTKYLRDTYESYEDACNGYNPRTAVMDQMQDFYAVGDLLQESKP